MHRTAHPRLTKLSVYLGIIIMRTDFGPFWSTVNKMFCLRHNYVYVLCSYIHKRHGGLGNGTVAKLLCLYLFIIYSRLATGKKNLLMLSDSNLHSGIILFKSGFFFITALAGVTGRLRFDLLTPSKPQWL